MDERGNGSEPVGDRLAEERTEYAEDRTALANERTYSAWLRTGLTALAAGLGFERFLVGIMPGWAIRVVATALIVLAALCFAVAAWRYTHLGEKLPRARVPAVPAWAVVTASALMVAMCVLILATLVWS